MPSLQSADPAATGSLLLSFIIPTDKESARLPQTFGEILPYLESRFPAHEILMVDDNSPDGTGNLVPERVKKHPQIRLTQPGKIGKGAVVRRGCLEVNGQYVLFRDANHWTPIEELDQFMPLVAPTQADARPFAPDRQPWAGST